MGLNRSLGNIKRKKNARKSMGDILMENALLAAKARKFLKNKILNSLPNDAREEVLVLNEYWVKAKNSLYEMKEQGTLTDEQWDAAWRFIRDFTDN